MRPTDIPRRSSDEAAAPATSGRCCRKLPEAEQPAKNRKMSAERASSAASDVRRLSARARSRRHSLASSQAVDVARTRQTNPELALDASRMRRHQDHAIAEADGLADVVGDEDDRLAPSWPRSSAGPRKAARASWHPARRTARPSAAPADWARARAPAPRAASCRRRVRGCWQRVNAPSPPVPDDACATSRRSALRQARLQLEPEHDVAEHPATETARAPGTSSSGRGPDPRSSRRRSRHLPASGRVSPAMMLSSVVLPQPLGPTRQTNSPG